MADVEAAAADHVGGHAALALLDHLLLAAGDMGFASTVQPVLGLHPAEQQVLATAGMQQKSLDASDLHFGFPFVIRPDATRTGRRRAPEGPAPARCVPSASHRSRARPAAPRPPPQKRWQKSLSRPQWHR